MILNMGQHFKQLIIKKCQHDAHFTPTPSHTDKSQQHDFLIWPICSSFSPPRYEFPVSYPYLKFTSWAGTCKAQTNIWKKIYRWHGYLLHHNWTNPHTLIEKHDNCDVMSGVTHD